MKVFSVVGGCAGKTEIVRRLVIELAGRAYQRSSVYRKREISKSPVAAHGNIARPGPRK
jgi:hypothetical protein